MTTCPECRADKHRNCHGDAWDDATDSPTVCDCWVTNHGDAR